jgi:hypothetical protein
MDAADQSRDLVRRDGILGEIGRDDARRLVDIFVAGIACHAGLK